MASEKTVNYTEAQTAELVEAYKADATKATVAAVAAKFGKTTRRIMAKLSREGVYVAQDAKAKTGAKATTKAHLVDSLEVMFDLTKGTLATLEKGSKEALEALVAAVDAKTL